MSLFTIECPRCGCPDTTPSTPGDNGIPRVMCPSCGEEVEVDDIDDDGDEPVDSEDRAMAEAHEAELGWLIEQEQAREQKEA